MEAISLNTRPKISSRARVQIDKVSGKQVLVYPEGILVLNPTGSAIVALCDGVRTFSDIVTTLAERYLAPPEAITGDVTQYLMRLHAKNLVEFLSDAADKMPLQKGSA